MITINNSECESLLAAEGWLNNKRLFYDTKGIYKYEVSIVIIAYNRLEEKTKPCVDSVLRYLPNEECELILVDSGSTDETIKFYDELEYNQKKVLKIEKNMGLGYALSVAYRYAMGKYIAFVANDCVVTKNWLENLLKCIRSSTKIGMVCPGASNVSNAQEVDIGQYESMEEMQDLAASYNVSNPSLWEYRPRLINPVALYRAEVFDYIGYMDPGFRHDFGEDDIARGIHRAGYRMVLCKDTFIAHNHVQSERQPEEYAKRIENGRRCFVEKYREIDPWDDINNYIGEYISEMDVDTDGEISVLGVNIRCGTPFLDILNRICGMDDKRDICFDAYTTDLKYYTDLAAFPANVKSGEVRKIDNFYERESKDILVTTETVDKNDEPLEVLKKYMHIIKKGGYLLFPLKNRKNILSYIDKLMGEKTNKRNYAENEVLDVLEAEGAENVWINEERYQDSLKNSIPETVKDAVYALMSNEQSDGEDSIYVENFWYLVRK